MYNKTFVLTSRKVRVGYRSREGERRREYGGERYELKGHGKDGRGRRGAIYRVAQR